MKNLHQFQVTFVTDCSQLVKIVSEPEEWPAFEVYLEDIKVLMGSFRNTKIIHVPRTENSRADSLARSARKQLSFIVHMDAVLSAWFAESI
ncbi:BnaC04g37580D [Brassica napus]|uniref:BnaC04g37580D protein n=1 Tax=Brassica napus TaxID=3708 RepID=A0A078IZ41_BRANA|nr:BnaC04g37580D [Brassica napus]